MLSFFTRDRKTDRPKEREGERQTERETDRDDDTELKGTTQQDPVVQSIVSLTSSFVVKLLTVLLSKISNSQVFLLKKNVSSCKSYSHFFQQKY